MPDHALTNFVQPCANLGDYYAVLGLGSTISIPFNVDKARIKGAEVAGRYQFFPGLPLRANYTYADRKQQTGVSADQPLTQSASPKARCSTSSLRAALDACNVPSPHVTAAHWL